MKSISASIASAKLDILIDEAASRQPVCIVGKDAKAILISDQDLRAISETLFLLSVPDMRESIHQGVATPLSECSEEPGW